MNKSKLLIASAAMLVALAGVGGVSIAAYASDDAGTSTPIQKVKNCFWKNKNLTQAQKEELKVQMQARQNEMKVKMDAVKAALDANNYDAWVKAVGANAPILKKINKDNFSKYVEAQKLFEQANGIMKDLGLNNGMDEKGFGPFHGAGQVK